MKIAIIGAGISGMMVAYRLSPVHEVTLFESNDYLGGHTNTVEVELGGERQVIDTGFIVFNDWTYPTFIQLLDESVLGRDRRRWASACGATRRTWSTTVRR